MIKQPLYQIPFASYLLLQHGVLKVRTTEEQRLKKQKEQEKKLAAYRLNVGRILTSRSENNYSPSDLQLCALILSSNPDVYTLWNYRKEAVLIELNTKYINIIVFLFHK